MKRIPLFLFLSLAFVSIQAQTAREQLAFYSDVLMNASKTEHRQRAFDQVNQVVDDVLAEDQSLEDDFQDVPWLSVVSDSQSTFRIVTWQLSIDDSVFRYGGRIQFHDGQILALNESGRHRDLENSVLSKDTWYGARYYKIEPFQDEDGIAYVLLGFNAHSKWNRRRVAEVLSFDENRMPVFGKPVFVKAGEDPQRHGRHRLLLTYSRDARVIMDYDAKLDMIVHDHLIPIGERYPGQGPSFVSDASFEGYKRMPGGLWEYRERLFDQIQDTPLNDSTSRKPTERRDILGRVIRE